jgi:hypothetical protein
MAEDQGWAWSFLTDFVKVHFGEEGASVFAGVAGTLTIAYAAMMAITRVLEMRKHLSTRRAFLEEEKLVAEILKIRYEIAVLRKHNDLPELALPDKAATSAASAAPGSATHPSPAPGLPKVPAFSFTAGFVQIAAFLGRPAPGFPRALWSLKLLGATFAAVIVGSILIMVFVPDSTKEHSNSMVGPDFILISLLPLAYFTVTCLVNLVRGLLTPHHTAAADKA